MFNIKSKDIGQIAVPKDGYSSLVIDRNMSPKMVMPNGDVVDPINGNIEEMYYLRPINEIIDTISGIPAPSTKPLFYRIYSAEDNSIYEVIKSSDGTSYIYRIQEITTTSRAQLILENGLVGAWLIFSYGSVFVVNENVEHIYDYNNPHNVTKEQIGLGNVDDAEQATKEEFDVHVSDNNNPHKVTKYNLDPPLDQVLNVKQASQGQFDNHLADVRAHDITPKQVGLGNVTSDRQATADRLEKHAANKDADGTQNNNPHGITAADLHLENVVNSKPVPASVVNKHIRTIGNPHGTTPADVGLSDVKNETQLTKVEAEEQHMGHTGNVHNLSLVKLGLNNLDNTQQASKDDFDAHVGDQHAHGITKSTFGLGDITNDKQATEQEFLRHIQNKNILDGSPDPNPHRATPTQIGLAGVTNDKQATDSEYNQHISARNIHKVTKQQLGIPLVENIRHVNIDQYADHINDHKAHNIDKSQVGLGNVDNVLQANFDDFQNHKSRQDNPHQLTLSQVGLDNIDFTKDIDKPVSGPQQDAMDQYLLSIPDGTNSLMYDNVINPHYLTAGYFSNYVCGGYIEYDEKLNLYLIRSNNRFDGVPFEVLDPSIAQGVYFIFVCDGYINSSDSQIYGEGDIIIASNNKWYCVSNQKMSYGDVDVSEYNLDTHVTKIENDNTQPIDIATDTVGVIIEKMNTLYKEAFNVPVDALNDYYGLTTDVYENFLKYFSMGSFIEYNEPTLYFTIPIADASAEYNVLINENEDALLFSPSDPYAYTFDKNGNISKINASLFSLCERVKMFSDGTKYQYFGIPYLKYDRTSDNDTRNNDNIIYYTNGGSDVYYDAIVMQYDDVVDIVKNNDGDIIIITCNGNNGDFVFDISQIIPQDRQFVLEYKTSIIAYTVPQNEYSPKNPRILKQVGDIVFVNDQNGGVYAINIADFSHTKIQIDSLKNDIDKIASVAMYSDDVVLAATNDGRLYIFDFGDLAYDVINVNITNIAESVNIFVLRDGENITIKYDKKYFLCAIDNNTHEITSISGPTDFLYNTEVYDNSNRYMVGPDGVFVWDGFSFIDVMHAGTSPNTVLSGRYVECKGVVCNDDANMVHCIIDIMSNETGKYLCSSSRMISVSTITGDVVGDINIILPVNAEIFDCVGDATQSKILLRTKNDSIYSNGVDISKYTTTPIEVVSISASSVVREPAIAASVFENGKYNDINNIVLIYDYRANATNIDTIGRKIGDILDITLMRNDIPVEIKKIVYDGILKTYLDKNGVVYTIRDAQFLPCPWGVGKTIKDIIPLMRGVVCVVDNNHEMYHINTSSGEIINNINILSYENIGLSLCDEVVMAIDLDTGNYDEFAYDTNEEISTTNVLPYSGSIRCINGIGRGKAQLPLWRGDTMLYFDAISKTITVPTKKFDKSISLSDGRTIYLRKNNAAEMIVWVAIDTDQYVDKRIHCCNIYNNILCNI